MKLLIVTWALCLATSSVAGFFLDDTNAGWLGDKGQGQGARVKPSSPIKGSNMQSDSPAAMGFVGEIETSLQQAAGALDGLWLRFKRGVLRLLPGSGFGEDADNGRPAANGTLPGNLPQPKPISTELFTTTTARIITATTTTTETVTTTQAVASTTTNAVETTTEVTTELPMNTPIFR